MQHVQEGWIGGPAPQVARIVLVVAVAIGAVGSVGARTPDDPMETSSSLEQEQLYVLAPYIAQIVNLALFDPVLAANMVPEDWIDSVTENALAVEAEVPIQPGKSDPPHLWPIGPWPSPASLATSIEAFQPVAVASLYDALRPRFAQACKRRGRSLAACEGAIRTSMSRLSDPSVRARAIGKPVKPMTPTQLELARLGEPVVLAVRKQIEVVGKTLWGPPRTSTP